MSLSDIQPESTTTSSLGRWISTTVVIVLVAAMGAYLWGQQDELASLWRVSVALLLVTCALQVASQMFLNASLLIPLQTIVPTLGFWELYLVRTGGFLVGSVVPIAGGLAVRLAYLRTKGVAYLDFTWATLFSNVLALAAAAVLAAGATGVLWVVVGRPPALVIAMSAAVVAVSVMAAVFVERLPWLARRSWLQRWRWVSALGSERAIGRAVGVPVFACALLRHGLNFVTFGLLYQALTGNPRDFFGGGIVYALTSPIRMVNFTPANLGITEWFVALAGKALVFDVATGLIVALAFRGLGVVAQALGALFASVWLAFRRRQTAPARDR